MPWVTGKPEIIRPRIGVDLGVGEEFSISLATKITNSDGCRVCGSDGQRTKLWLRRLDLNQRTEKGGCPSGRHSLTPHTLPLLRTFPRLQCLGRTELDSKEIARSLEDRAQGAAEHVPSKLRAKRRSRGRGDCVGSHSNENDAYRAAAR